MRNIYICSNVYNKFISLANAHRRCQPDVFLCGEDKDKIIRKIYLLKPDPGTGCSNMPDIDGKTIAKAYIKAAKDKYIPAGMARIHRWIENEGYVFDDTGPVIEQCGKYLISVYNGQFIAESSKQLGQDNLTICITNKKKEKPNGRRKSSVR